MTVQNKTGKTFSIRGVEFPPGVPVTFDPAGWPPSKLAFVTSQCATVAAPAKPIPKT